jgi:cold shock protein
LRIKLQNARFAPRRRSLVVLGRAHVARPAPQNGIQIGSNTMAVGTVKFFNAEKGYGFISRDGADDVFVHYSNIQGSGYRSLEAGQQVEFEVGPGRKGDEAQNVRVV